MKRKVTICTGTACYVLGGANLLLLDEYLPDGIRKNVIVEGTPCLGLCKNGKDKPPFVRIDDKTVISSATIQSIIDVLVRG